MAFTIHCDLDITDGFEPDALLGSIEFSDGGTAFGERAVYLDTWLCALNQSARSIEGGSREAVIDLIEEPQPLQVVLDSLGTVHLAFRHKEVIAGTVADFRSAVAEATNSFVKRVRKLSNSDYELPCEMK